MSDETWAADWYPHPSRPGYLRYYDGTAWTDYVTVEGAAVIGRESDFPDSCERPNPLVSAAGSIAAAAQHSVDHSPTWLGGRPLVGTDQQRAQLVCQFCQQVGYVTARRVARVKGKTATRLVGGLATMGGSLLLTGVSKKGDVTEMSCSNCGTTWDVGGV